MSEEQDRFSIHELYSRICREHSQLYNDLDATMAALKQAPIAMESTEELDRLLEKWDEAYTNCAQAAVRGYPETRLGKKEDLFDS